MEADLRVTAAQARGGAGLGRGDARRTLRLPEWRRCGRSGPLTSRQLEELARSAIGRVQQDPAPALELSSRAEEGIRTQVRLRDVETELSVAQAGLRGGARRNRPPRRRARGSESRRNGCSRLQNQLDEEEPAERRPASWPGDLALDC